jgi:hypothetical protein
MPTIIDGTNGVTTTAVGKSGNLLELPAADGTAGQVLSTDGSGALGFSSTPQVRIYTSPTTWEKPAGLTSVRVTVIAGGGGSSGARAGPPGRGLFGGGGSAGGTAEALIPAPSIPGPVSVTVGAGGAGGPAPATNFSNSASNPGAASSFGSFASATGGGGQTAVTQPAANSLPGGVGAIDSSLFGTTWTGGLGGSGGSLNSVPASIPLAAVGGVSAKFGSFSAKEPYTPNPAAGGTLAQSGVWGNGGTGGVAGPGTSNPVAGAAGGDGIVIIEEFY